MINIVKSSLNSLKIKITMFFKLILLILEDILISIGVIIINATTYRISLNAGFYVTGVTFLALGIYFAKNPIKRG